MKKIFKISADGRLVSELDVEQALARCFGGNWKVKELPAEPPKEQPKDDVKMIDIDFTATHIFVEGECYTKATLAELGLAKKINEILAYLRRRGDEKTCAL